MKLFRGLPTLTNYSLYIVLTRSRTIVSKLIHVVGQDEYTHAAISFDRDLEEMYSFGRKYTYMPFIGRFRKENLNEGVYKTHENLPGLIIEVKVTELQYGKAKDVLDDFINNSEIYKYNYLGLVFNFLQRESNNENKFICSEFVYHILKESGIFDINISRNLVRPETFRANLQKQIIYEGNLKKLSRGSHYKYMNSAD